MLYVVIFVVCALCTAVLAVGGGWKGYFRMFFLLCAALLMVALAPAFQQWMRGLLY